jgi:hypothetical protein
MFKILFATADVLDDAHNTFLKEEDEIRDKETELDELKRGKQAFTYSDEEVAIAGNFVDENVMKAKYNKKKKLRAIGDKLSEGRIQSLE